MFQFHGMVTANGKKLKHCRKSHELRKQKTVVLILRQITRTILEQPQKINIC